MTRIAIIGAGPGGLVAARYLRESGHEPTLFDQGDRIGGQWTGDPRYSGVWPSMRTNTSRVMTAFSDLQHAPNTCVYPTNQAVRDYLERYAERFGLVGCVRLGSRVEEISPEPSGKGWAVRFQARDGAEQTEVFPKVVVASGRYNKPMIPNAPGLESFSGCRGVCHAFGYKDPESYRGMRVLVAGCSISALEIASDLAMLGAARVISTNRRQRYVLHKIVAGVPVEHLAFTRFAALAEESFPPGVVAAGLKEFVTRTSGSPEQFGAPKPADDIFEAGITQCQHFLPLVAEGRIMMRPWITEIDGQAVRFSDGTVEQVDAIIFGTGYDLNLPFLGDGLRRTLGVDAHHIDLHNHTFHPDAPGLAFVGLYELVGPYFPVLELQARWIARAWRDSAAEPSRADMEAGVAACRARRGGPQQFPMHALALLFSRATGAEPDLSRWPSLARALMFGPLAPVSFRLNGPDSLPDAPRLVAEAAGAFGAVPAPELTPDQRHRLRALAAARSDDSFTRFVEQVAGAPGSEAGA